MSDVRSTDGRSLIERLRSRAWIDRQHRKLREEAAKEIEQLRARLKAIDDSCVLGHEPAMTSALLPNYRSLGYCRKCGVHLE